MPHRRRTLSELLPFSTSKHRPYQITGPRCRAQRGSGHAMRRKSCCKPYIWRVNFSGSQRGIALASSAGARLHRPLRKRQAQCGGECVTGELSRLMHHMGKRARSLHSLEIQAWCVVGGSGGPPVFLTELFIAMAKLWLRVPVALPMNCSLYQRAGPLTSFRRNNVSQSIGCQRNTPR